MTRLWLSIVLLAWACPGAAQTDRYGSRKPPCGCYVCGKLVAVTFPNVGECAGILAADACGNHLENLPPHDRQAFCDKIKRDMKFSSFQASCGEYAAACGGGTSPADGSRPSTPPAPGKSSPAPGAAGAPAPPAGSPPAQGSREAFIAPHGTQSPAPEREWFVRPGEQAPAAAQSAAGAATSAASQGISAGASQTAKLVRIRAVRFNPEDTTGGNPVRGIVELADVPDADGVTVALESGDPSLASVPSSIKITRGATSADVGSTYGVGTFPVTTNIVPLGASPNRTVTVRATASGQTVEGRLVLRTARLTLARFDATKCAGTKADFKYALSGPASEGMQMRLDFEVRAGNYPRSGRETVDIPRGTTHDTVRVFLPACLPPGGGTATFACTITGYAYLTGGPPLPLNAYCSGP